MKTLFYKYLPLSLNKSFEFQLSLFKPQFLYNIFNLQADLLTDYQYAFSFLIHILGDLFMFSIGKSKNCDHQGFYFELTLLGLSLELLIYDDRNWDHDNNCFEE